MKLLGFLFIFFLSPIKVYSEEKIVELQCETDKEDNNQISFFINYDTKEILFKSSSILKRNPEFSGYDYKIRQLSEDHLTAYEPRNKDSIGASIVVINRETGRFVQSTVGNYGFGQEHPLTILSEQGFCKRRK